MYSLESCGVILVPVLWGRWDQDMILDGTLSRKVWTHLGTCHHFHGTSWLIRLYVRIMIDPFIDILHENLQLPFEKMFRGYQVHVHRVKSGFRYIIGLDYGLATLKQHLAQLPSFLDLHSGVNAAWLMHSQINHGSCTFGRQRLVLWVLWWWQWRSWLFPMEVVHQHLNLTEPIYSSPINTKEVLLCKFLSAFY